LNFLKIKEPKVYNMKSRTKVNFFTQFQNYHLFFLSFSLLSSLFQSCPWSTNLKQLGFNLPIKGCNMPKISLRIFKKIIIVNP
jgi:hypothetical protein